MITIIKRVLKKLKPKAEEKPAIRQNIYISVPESTIFLDGTSIRFDNSTDDRKYITVGEYGIIRASFIFESSSGYIKIGNNVHIGSATIICRSSIEVENDVTMAWGITLYDHDSHSVFWDHRKNDNAQCYKDYIEFNGNNVVNKDWANVLSKPIHICSKVWIGFDVTVLKGVTIGEGAVVGAKSVVTKDVPAWTVVAGNPAKVVRQLK